jgi:shikimate dehydrogenase
MHEMKKYGLVGYPLAHSLSPRIHKSIYETYLINATYDIIEVKPDKIDDARDFLQNYDGFNVTIPHKVDIINILNDIDKASDIYGSVNTVRNDGGMLIGYNTDAEGFLSALRLYDIPADGNVILYGAGGAARAAAVSVLQMGGKLTVAARNIEKAKDMVEEIRDNLYERELATHFFKTKRARQLAAAAVPEVEVVPYSHIGQYDTIVNATPAGMAKEHINECVVPVEVIDACTNVFDMVYSPRDTILIKQAMEFKKNAHSGMAMLVYQALGAIDLWEELDDRVDEGYTEDMIMSLEAEFR